jgi:hypothetical protein
MFNKGGKTISKQMKIFQVKENRPQQMLILLTKAIKRLQNIGTIWVVKHTPRIEQGIFQEFFQSKMKNDDARTSIKCVVIKIPFKFCWILLISYWSKELQERFIFVVQRGIFFSNHCYINMTYSWHPNQPYWNITYFFYGCHSYYSP